MKINKVSAFSDNQRGGNPAGVTVLEGMPSEADMQAIAADVGFSETVFSAPDATATHGTTPDSTVWRVRYFSPQHEVAFCGHATIALGAVLAKHHGQRTFNLRLNHTEISVDGFERNGQYSAAFQSPKTYSLAVEPNHISDALKLFGLQDSQLDKRIPPAIINAGVNHLLLNLMDHETLRQMRYDLEAGKAFMQHLGVTTVMLVFKQNDHQYHARNAFAPGGVYEDPATGAAAAAFAGYLRDSLGQGAGQLEITQGEDMGFKSIINASFTSQKASSVRIAGATHVLP